MARKQAKTILDMAIADARWREEHQAREFQRLNKAAARSIANNAAVVGWGALDNAIRGTLPFVNARRRRREQR